MEYLDILKCPITNNPLRIANEGDFDTLNPIDLESHALEIEQGLVDLSNTYFYPIVNDIILLLEHYALFIGENKDQRKATNINKKRVFDYYNEIDYVIKESKTIYEDSGQWVDYREVSKDYIRKSFCRAANFYAPTGKYFLDIASGPIGLQEYIDLSKGYDTRICIDLSFKALVQAKRNLEAAGRKGIYICGDITKIPLQEGVCDTVLCQHTLYHVPKEEQKQAVEELYRVGKPKSKIVIIYHWFYHGWLMNGLLNVVRLYEVTRYLGRELYTKYSKDKSRLYFYPHSPGWFKRSFEFSEQIAFYSWRTTTKMFLSLFIHKHLGGKAFLNWLSKMEDKHSKVLGRYGDYAAIVISKDKGG
ncbi:MAG: hypothetical protein Sapg2KO_31510 [Saprospiraceae bacterium]